MRAYIRRNFQWQKLVEVWFIRDDGVLITQGKDADTYEATIHPEGEDLPAGLRPYKFTDEMLAALLEAAHDTGLGNDPKLTGVLSSALDIERARVEKFITYLTEGQS